MLNFELVWNNFQQWKRLLEEITTLDLLWENLVSAQILGGKPDMRYNAEIRNLDQKWNNLN